MLTPLAQDALNAYGFADDAESRHHIERKIASGEYIRYTPGTLVSFTGYEDGHICRVRIEDGSGLEGWVHDALMDITKESEAYLAKREEQQRTAETNKRAAAKKLAEDRKRAAEEAERKEEAYIRSLPLLIGPGDEVAVATSMDCAKDLRDIVAFGKRMEQALNSAGRCSNSSRWDAPLRSRAEHGY